MMWKHFYCFALHFFCLTSLASASCPSGCVCANALIVCTCQGAQSDVLTLQPFHGIEYISKVYVHSCKMINIPADTFAGLAIGKELSISGIQEIRFEPFAFREMQKYPEQITFRDSNIPSIPENTFAGLNKAIHLWFRNTTITRIHSYAFRDVSRLDYLYFRESSIKTIEAAAFGSMFHISHFFIRGRVTVGEMCDHLFRNSRIGEIVFEDVTIKSMDVLALAGAKRFDTFQLSNCSIESTAFPTEPKFPFKPTQSGGKLEFLKTNIQHLALGPFSNVMELKFHHSRIQELRESAATLHNVTLLQFSKTLINYIIDRSMASSSNIKDIVIDECAIDTIFPDSFVESSQISYLIFLNTRFIKFEKHAFRGLNLGSLILDGCELETINSEAFSKVNASETIKIVNSKIRNLKPNAFKDAQTNYFGLEENRVEQLYGSALSEVRTKEANISDNHFQQIQPNSFSGILTAYFLLTSNRFVCKCNSQFAPLLAMSQEESRWGFRDNLCSNQYNSTVSMLTFEENCPQSSIKLKQTPLSQNFVCFEMAFFTKCFCPSTSTSWEWITSETFSALSPHTTQLWIKDCQGLRLNENSFSAMKTLAVLKIDQVKNIELHTETFAAPAEIRVIEISGSKIAEIPQEAFKNLPKLEFVTISKSTIREIKTKSFSQVQIKNLLFRESTINKIHSNFISDESTIEEFSIIASHLGTLERETFSDAISVKKIVLDSSHIVSIEKNAMEPQILMTSLICFASNNLACHCENQGALQILQHNHCSEAAKQSFCYEPPSAKNKDVLAVLKSSVRLAANNLADGRSTCDAEIESHFVPSQSLAANTNKVGISISVSAGFIAYVCMLLLI